MAPNKQRNPSHKEFRAEHPKVSVRQAPRKPVQRRPHDISDASITASHGEEPSIERDTAPPREDRAG